MKEVGQNKVFTVGVRSTHESSWNGKISTFRKEAIEYYNHAKEVHPDFNLHRDFFLTQEEFSTIFSSAHINSARKDKYITGYHLFSIEPKTTKAQFFEF